MVLEPAAARDKSLLRDVLTCCGAHPALYSVRTAGSSFDVNRPEREADYSSQSNVFWYLPGMHRDSFTIYPQYVYAIFSVPNLRMRRASVIGLRDPVNMDLPSCWCEIKFQYLCLCA